MKLKAGIIIYFYWFYQRSLVLLYSELWECAKLGALRALVPYVPSRLKCLRALRAILPYVPSRLTCPRVLCALRALHAIYLVPYTFCLVGCSISRVNQRISNISRGNPFVFIDNSNIPTSSLFRDGLHLVEVGKRILANNVIDNLNNFSQIKKTHLTYLHLNYRKPIWYH